MRLFVALLALAACSTAPAPCEPPGTQVTAPRSAGCLAVHEGKLLMIRTTDARWSIPGGYLESGEGSGAAAARETQEEAGVSVIPGPPVCAVPSKGFVAHACVLDHPQEPRADGSETTDARFFTAEELAALPTAELRYPDQRATWLAVLEAAAQAEARARGER